MYQHVNHATMVTILEEARVPFLTEPFANDFDTIGLLIAEVKVTYKGQLRLADSPLQVTIWVQAAACGGLHARLRGAVGARRSGLEAGRDRRIAAGGVPHRGAEARAAGAAPSGVSPAIPAMSACAKSRRQR